MMKEVRTETHCHMIYFFYYRNKSSMTKGKLKLFTSLFNFMNYIGPSLAYNKYSMILFS